MKGQKKRVFDWLFLNSSLAWTQILTHCVCSCSLTSWRCGPESTICSSSCTRTGRYMSEYMQQCEYSLYIVYFCIAGLQKSVAAAKLLVLRCTLPILSEPGGGWRSWRKKQTQTHSWPDAAEHAHNVPRRFVLGELKLNPALTWRCTYPSVTSSYFHRCHIIQF